MHLVMHHQGQPSKAEPFWQESASYLVICALSRVYNNLPASTGDLPSCGVASRSTDGLRAIINHCNRSRDTPFAIDLRFLTWIGFSEVLSNPSRYGLDEHEAFQRMFSTWNADGRNEVNRYIEALYNSFPPYERSSGITDLKDMKVSPYLRAIEQVFKVAQLDNPTELVYIFVVEMMCRVKSDSIQELYMA
ncbi:unnamed protein product [Rhizoctonia solani]|uniref:Uncharacterized protein n=1 Tax=Rhizoctonia solani TaxID=456999 RepID=A0A8H3GH89_9AGAM|nr:unnamed protein product [Rhizoctonia solani]